MKKRKRLYPKEAKSLGFKPRKEKGRKTAVYDLTADQLEKIEKLRNTSETVPNDYEDKPLIMSAWDEKSGKILSVKDFCEKYGLPAEDVTSSKFLPYHYGVPTYHIVFKERIETPFLDFKEVRKIIRKELGKKTRFEPFPKGSRKGVVKIADLHLGAKITGLLKTKDFDLGILKEMLLEAADKINGFNYDVVHVHFLGDLIESFTGLNHKNSFKSMDPNLIGAEAVIVAVKVIKECFLDHIKNLGAIKIVAGNHDRVTSDNKEDTDGDAAKLISWGLELQGFDVEFHPKVITHVVDGIAHIISHGHLGISKDVKSMCWDYGVQGLYNLVTFGHLHSVIKKLSAKQREQFDTTFKDSQDSRGMYCLSFFTGNSYSEDLSYTTSGGFHIIEDNGKGSPNVFDFAL